AVNRNMRVTSVDALRSNASGLVLDEGVMPEVISRIGLWFQVATGVAAHRFQNSVVFLRDSFGLQRPQMCSGALARLDPKCAAMAAVLLEERDCVAQAAVDVAAVRDWDLDSAFWRDNRASTLMVETNDRSSFGKCLEQDSARCVAQAGE